MGVDAEKGLRLLADSGPQLRVLQDVHWCHGVGDCLRGRIRLFLARGDVPRIPGAC
ncbi:hypothetical protein GCM10007301_14790 [Azorhizobium oxalatiphilum]|uniref:Uncharacterized protein n=1 Tax=Azorhizobium oxalatiphilum TaxID=980631 RepID=A0A917BSX0_9HYPH|nr:hypothetical protein GCM10007301_14790 [Azorhizobium oxalatiphilum]